MMSKYRLLSLLFVLLVSISCNKEDEPTRAVNVEVWGYNIGDAELETSIDTTVYRNFTTLPNKPLTFSKIYTFHASKKEGALKIKDKTSGKDVFQQQLNLSSGNFELFFPFVYINGNELKLEIPAADSSTNKLSFYIHYPKSSDGLDIFLQNETGQIAYIAKNVKPGTWIHTDYIPGKDFQDKNKPYILYFTKTGTIDSWYFEDSESISKVGEPGLLFPKNAEKGLVRTYFVTPGNLQLDVIRLFKRP